MAIKRNGRTTNSTEANTGRYVQGGLTDIYRNRLGWWERYEFERSTSDIRFVIRNQYVGRPDLVAYEVYKKANLAWLVLEYNNIVDINTEFVAGKVLTLPTPARAQVNILNKSTGGNIVQ